MKFMLPLAGIAVWSALLVTWLYTPERETPRTILLGVLAAFCAIAGLLLIDKRRP